MRTRAGNAAKTRDPTKIEPRDDLCRGAGDTRETISEVRAKLLHHGPQVVDDRTHLVNEWIHPRPRSLQERTRRLGDGVQPLHERTHIFGKMSHERTHIFG